jgi:hypothetical protein
VGEGAGLRAGDRGPIVSDEFGMTPTLTPAMAAIVTRSVAASVWPVRLSTPPPGA